MKIKFIGSGSGKTSLKRFHSSLLFSTNNYNLLVDAGDGISKALLSQKISYNQINGILISHLHPDHFAGLSGLIIQMKLQERGKKLEIFVHKSLIEYVRDFLYHTYILSTKLNFELNFVEYEENKEIIVEKKLSFIAKQNSHLDKYKKFDDKKLLNFSCSSFLFIYENKKIFYTGDIGSESDLFLFDDYKIDLIIAEISHVRLEELISANKILKSDIIYLTHISDEDEESLSSFINSLAEYKKGKFVIAYDGLSFEI